MRPALILLFAVAATTSFGQLTRHEEATLADVMTLAGISESDLGFDKKQDPDPDRLPLNVLALDKPLAAADALARLHQTASGTLADALASGCEAAFGDTEPSHAAMTNAVNLPGTVPEKLRRPLSYLIGCIGEANSAIRRALKDLNAEERRELIEGLPQWSVGSSEIKLGFVSRAPLDRKALFALLRRVDLKTIRRASVVLSRRIEEVLPQWRTLSKSVRLKGVIRFKADGIKVELSGQGDDDHETLDSSLCIDLGGHNTYRGRYGAGVGYSSVLMDFGTSEFEVPDLSIGAGVLGIGLAYQLGGRGDYKGHSLCFGAGVAGVGAFYVDAGGNRFRSLSMTQGFGSFGVGMLVCAGGSDAFRADLYAQGAARTEGLGWLIAQRGNDFFRAGGRVASADGHLSCSQAFASGIEDPFTSGGVGLLTSLGSDNTYVGERGCQAAAENGGVGSLYDAGGGGVRSATSHAQGFADHEAAAFLFDLGGSDQFGLRKATGQGFASRLSTCVTIAQQGHDQFLGGGSGATATGGSLSIFVSDGPGSSFAGYPGNALTNGLDSIALFCSIGSNIRLMEDSSSSVRVLPSGSVTWQDEAPPYPEPLLPPSEAAPAPPAPPTAVNLKAVMGQALSSNVFISRAALVQLLSAHDPSIPGTAAALLSSPDLLVRRLAIRVLAQYPSEAFAAADCLLGSGEAQTIRTGVRLLGTVGTQQAIERIAARYDTLPKEAQLEALEQMDTRVPTSFLTKLSALQTSPDPLIRALARSVFVNR